MSGNHVLGCRFEIGVERNAVDESCKMGKRSGCCFCWYLYHKIGMVPVGIYITDLW